MNTKQKRKSTRWKTKLYQIIYRTDTKAGKLFDIVLLILILLSVIVVMLESIEHYNVLYGTFFNISEWIITILFTIEYIARIVSINRPSKYIFSFYGIVDLLSTIPKYLSLFFIGTSALVALRALRLLRVFRILKLVRFVGESNKIAKALRASRPKISVFLFAVLILSVILGTVMYMIEGPSQGFTSIPMSVYWTIVTLTTVGYGDIAPGTPWGQVIASIVMILGYGIIAVPTGIVSAELTRDQSKTHDNTEACPNCAAKGHQYHSEYCFKCGSKLHHE